MKNIPGNRWIPENHVGVSIFSNGIQYNYIINPYAFGVRNEEGSYQPCVEAKYGVLLNKFDGIILESSNI